MNHNDIQRHFEACPDLAGVDPVSAENLFWRAENQTLKEGDVLFRQGAKLDNAFGLLLSGRLAVERAGEPIGTVIPQQIFGEMAYFSYFRTRNATIRVSSTQASILKFSLSPIELGSRGFSALRKCLASLTVSRATGPSPILIT
jgi:hypothetical protein